MSTVTKHFVVFMSPGIFFHEMTEKPIESWDVDKAVKMARTISERNGTTPFGFQFTTRKRGENDLDSKEAKRSGMYYLGGIVETLSEVEKRDDPKESILLSNMKCNGWDKIIVNTNSWKVVQPFTDNDTLLDFKVEKKETNVNT